METIEHDVSADEKIKDFLTWIKDPRYQHSESDIKLILKKLFTD